MVTMPVRNVHERRFSAAPSQVGALLDGLASPDDRLWPSARWPRMRLTPSLQVAARGGHGPVRYVVETFVPGRLVRFRFTAPRGFDGVHAFEVVEDEERATTLRHVLEMTPRGWARLTWPLVFRPLHDALIEDGLDNAARALGEEARARPWPLRVRVLRTALRLLV